MYNDRVVPHTTCVDVGGGGAKSFFVNFCKMNIIADEFISDSSFG